MPLPISYIDNCTYFICMHSNHCATKIVDHTNILIIATGAHPVRRHFQLKLQVLGQLVCRPLAFINLSTSTGLSITWHCCFTQSLQQLTGSLLVVTYHFPAQQCLSLCPSWSFTKLVFSVQIKPRFYPKPVLFENQIAIGCNAAAQHGTALSCLAQAAAL